MSSRLLSAVSILLLLISGACSNSRQQETARELLATVPSDAAYTAVINIDRLVSSTGGKVKDHTEIEPSAMLRKFLGKIESPVMSAHVDSILAGKAGVDFSCMVLFENEGTLWLTAPLADAGKTKAYLGRNGYDLQPAGDGLLSAREVILNENQIWITPSDSVANAGAADTFSRINSEQSMLSSDYADRLTEMTEAYIDLWDITLLWKTLGSKADQARIITAFTFEDVHYASFTAEMTQNSLTANGRFLDSEFKDADCNLATGKLEARDFDILGDKAEAVCGLSIDSKLMKNVIKAVSAFGGAVPPKTADALKNIEGPLVMASDSDNNIILSIPCKKGKEESVVNAIDALTLILGNNPGMRMTSRPEAVLISFNEGPQSGVPAKKIGEKLDGAWLGLAFNSDYYPRIEPVKNVSVALVPVRSSVLEFRMRIDY